MREQWWCDRQQIHNTGDEEKTCKRGAVSALAERRLVYEVPIYQSLVRVQQPGISRREVVRWYVYRGFRKQVKGSEIRYTYNLEQVLVEGAGNIEKKRAEVFA